MGRAVGDLGKTRPLRPWVVDRRPCPRAWRCIRAAIGENGSRVLLSAFAKGYPYCPCSRGQKGDELVVGAAMVVVIGQEQAFKSRVPTPLPKNEYVRESVARDCKRSDNVRAQRVRLLATLGPPTLGPPTLGPPTLGPTPGPHCEISESLCLS